MSRYLNVRRAVAAGLMAFVLAAPAASLRAQAPQEELLSGPALRPGEVQQLLDAYTIVQAQEFLGLSDAQYAPFVTRLKALQEVRRRNQQMRFQLLQGLVRMTAPKAPEVREADLRERLKALQELDSRSAADIQKAYEGIDQILDVRQQARFRVFEEQMERRKLDLLMRARNAAPRLNAPRNQRPLAQPR